MDRITMGSPLSPMVPTHIMGGFKEESLHGADYKANCWFHSINDIFVNWSQGTEGWRAPQLTVETATDEHLIIDNNIYTWKYGSLVCEVTRKVTFFFECECAPPSSQQAFCAVHLNTQGQSHVWPQISRFNLAHYRWPSKQKLHVNPEWCSSTSARCQGMRMAHCTGQTISR